MHSIPVNGLVLHRYDRHRHGKKWDREPSKAMGFDEAEHFSFSTESRISKRPQRILLKRALRYSGKEGESFQHEANTTGSNLQEEGISQWAPSCAGVWFYLFSGQFVCDFCSWPPPKALVDNLLKHQMWLDKFVLPPDVRFHQRRPTGLAPKPTGLTLSLSHLKLVENR